MTFWDGTQWVRGEPPPRRSRAPSSRLAAWIATAIMILGLTAPAIPQLVDAASHKAADPGCAVNPASTSVGTTYVVTAWGIPTGMAVNLWVTEAGTTSVRPLGSTPDGAFNLTESSERSGATTYAFSGPVKKHTQFYATCSVNVD